MNYWCIEVEKMNPETKLPDGTAILLLGSERAALNSIDATALVLNAFRTRGDIAEQVWMRCNKFVSVDRLSKVLEDHPTYREGDVDMWLSATPCEG